MSTNTVQGGVRTNRIGDIVHGNGSKLTADELQALPVAIKKSLGVKPKVNLKVKLKVKPKVKLKVKPKVKPKGKPKAGEFVKDIGNEGIPF